MDNMNTTLEAFQAQQQVQVTLLQDVLRCLHQGTDELRISCIPDHLFVKLNKVIDETVNEHLKVVLAGGFSEGKTSLAAAWLGKLDKSQMNISQAESTNVIGKYQVELGTGKYVDLIDTPGLFGFKENETTGEQEKYKDLTKKYLSESHLLLYVMDSSNPLKSSHTSLLQWLFRDLNMLPRTVFVLNKFDQVADMEDEEEYQEMLAIKQENVRGRLRDMIQLTTAEEDQLSIVGVSAAPEKPIEYWLQHHEDLPTYLRLSHIGLLQSATTEKVQQSGGLAGLTVDMQRTVLREAVDKVIPDVKEYMCELQTTLERLETEFERKENYLVQVKDELRVATQNTKRQIEQYLDRLIKQVRNTTLDTFATFMQTCIGEEGSILDQHISQICDEQQSLCSSSIRSIGANTELSAGMSLHLRTDVIQGTSKLLSGLKFIDNKTVLLIRDTLHIPFKFKAWGATKFASSLRLFGRLAEFLGPLLEGLAIYQEQQREQELAKKIEEVVGVLSQYRLDIGVKLGSDNYIENMATYREIADCIKESKHELETYEQYVKDVNAWTESLQQLQVRAQQCYQAR